jgi:hypothetical protein
VQGWEDTALAALTLVLLASKTLEAASVRQWREEVANNIDDRRASG